ncbi:hypothetical protein C8R45DRAFT_928063 [Mycena sanguinolenta]|nr:hypothetical protein C8R45DRAFT_928063 [Mycena sanguinolenta]
MFSKVLAFGLSALALVRAAPELTCSRGASVSRFRSFAAIEPGLYRIYNAAHGAELRSFSVGQQLFTTLTHDYVGPFALWNIQQHTEYEFTVSNVGVTESATHRELTYLKGELVTGPGQGDCFSIEPAGNGEFTIKLPYADAVWSIADAVNGLGQAGVYLVPANGAIETRTSYFSTITPDLKTVRRAGSRRSKRMARTRGTIIIPRPFTQGRWHNTAVAELESPKNPFTRQDEHAPIFAMGTSNKSGLSSLAVGHRAGALVAPSKYAENHAVSGAMVLCANHQCRKTSSPPLPGRIERDTLAACARPDADDMDPPTPPRLRGPRLRPIDSAYVRYRSMTTRTRRAKRQGRTTSKENEERRPKNKDNGRDLSTHAQKAQLEATPAKLRADVRRPRNKRRSSSKGSRVVERKEPDPVNTNTAHGSTCPRPPSDEAKYESKGYFGKVVREGVDAEPTIAPFVPPHLGEGKARDTELERVGKVRRGGEGSLTRRSTNPPNANANARYLPSSPAEAPSLSTPTPALLASPPLKDTRLEERSSSRIPIPMPSPRSCKHKRKYDVGTRKGGVLSTTDRGQEGADTTSDHTHERDSVNTHTHDARRARRPHYTNPACVHLSDSEILHLGSRRSIIHPLCIIHPSAEGGAARRHGLCASAGERIGEVGEPRVSDGVVLKSRGGTSRAAPASGFVLADGGMLPRVWHWQQLLAYPLPEREKISTSVSYAEEVRRLLDKIDMPREKRLRFLDHFDIIAQARIERAIPTKQPIQEAQQTTKPGLVAVKATKPSHHNEVVRRTGMKKFKKLPRRQSPVPTNSNEEPHMLWFICGSGQREGADRPLVGNLFP